MIELFQQVTSLIFKPIAKKPKEKYLRAYSSYETGEIEVREKIINVNINCLNLTMNGNQSFLIFLL